nr:immunoglobulin light chain junction region [Macaca mulatta]
CQHSYNLPLAF